MTRELITGLDPKATAKESQDVVDRLGDEGAGRAPSPEDFLAYLARMLAKDREKGGDEAGLYSKEEADRHAAHHGPEHVVHISEAPEFRAAAYNDLVIKHLTKQRDEAATAIQRLQSELSDALRGRPLPEDFGLSAVQAAEVVLRKLGIGCSASREPGSDRRRDDVARIVEAALGESEARAARLEGALRPFADANRNFPDPYRNGLTVECVLHVDRDREAILSTHDFQRAEEALKEPPAEKAPAGHEVGGGNG